MAYCDIFNMDILDLMGGEKTTMGKHQGSFFCFTIVCNYFLNLGNKMIIIYAFIIYLLSYVRHLMLITALCEMD